MQFFQDSWRCWECRHPAGRRCYIPWPKECRRDLINRLCSYSAGRTRLRCQSSPAIRNNNHTLPARIAQAPVPIGPHGPKRAVGLLHISYSFSPAAKLTTPRSILHRRCSRSGGSVTQLTRYELYSIPHRLPTSRLRKRLCALPAANYNRIGGNLRGTIPVGGGSIAELRHRGYNPSPTSVPSDLRKRLWSYPRRTDHDLVDQDNLHRIAYRDRTPETSFRQPGNCSPLDGSTFETSSMELVAPEIGCPLKYH